jgi:hypothetical protein
VRAFVCVCVCVRVVCVCTMYVRCVCVCDVSVRCERVYVSARCVCVCVLVREVLACGLFQCVAYGMRLVCVYLSSFFVVGRGSQAVRSRHDTGSKKQRRAKGDSQSTLARAFLRPQTCIPSPLFRLLAVRWSWSQPTADKPLPQPPKRA